MYTMVQKPPQIVFQYNAFDGQDQGNVVVVNITIIPVNDCPQNTNTYTNTVNEDSGGFTWNIGSVDTTRSG